MRGRLAILGALTVPWLAGCTLLGFPPGFDDFPEPSILATFGTGSASIAIKDGPTIELDQVAENSSLEATFGASVAWSSPDGWHLRITGGAGSGAFGSLAMITLDRIADGQHLTTMDPTRCIVDVDVADKTAVRGSATCRNVEWYDALDMGFGVGPDGPKPADEPPFDAEITFEATP